MDYRMGMLFYETGHKSLENQEIEKRLNQERRHCKEILKMNNQKVKVNTKQIQRKQEGSC